MGLHVCRISTRLIASTFSQPTHSDILERDIVDTQEQRFYLVAQGVLLRGEIYNATINQAEIRRIVLLIL